MNSKISALSVAIISVISCWSNSSAAERSAWNSEEFFVTNNREQNTLYGDQNIKNGGLTLQGSDDQLNVVGGNLTISGSSQVIDRWPNHYYMSTVNDSTLDIDGDLILDKTSHYSASGSFTAFESNNSTIKANDLKLINTNVSYDGGNGNGIILSGSFDINNIIVNNFSLNYILSGKESKNCAIDINGISSSNNSSISLTQSHLISNNINTGIRLTNQYNIFSQIKIDAIKMSGPSNFALHTENVNLRDSVEITNIDSVNTTGGNQPGPLGTVALVANQTKIGNGLVIRNNYASNQFYSIVAYTYWTDSEGIDFRSIGRYNQIEGDILSIALDSESSPDELWIPEITGNFNGEYSYFEGSTKSVKTQYDNVFNDDFTDINENNINLEFTNNSNWNVTDNSVLKTLKVSNESKINLGFNKTNEIKYKSIQTESLNVNNGTFVFQIDATGDETKSDKLIVSQKAEGTLNAEILIKNPELIDKKIPAWIISQGSGTLKIGEVKTQAGGVGSYRLDFFEDGSDTAHSESTGNAGKWFVTSDDGIDPVPEVADNLVLGVSASQAIAWLDEKNDLRKRLGEVRLGAPDGVWAQIDSRNETFGNGFKQKTYGFHFGLDKSLSYDNEKSLLIGAALRYANADQNRLANSSATGQLDQYSAKIYGTWIHNNGSYFDLVGMLGYYKQELNGTDNTGHGFSDADYSTYGYGLSFEFGRMFKFGNAQNDSRNAWFIEPQAELAYFVSHGKDYSTSTGLLVNQETADFLNLRAGVTFGKTFELDSSDNSYLQLSVKAGINHEFMGDQSIGFVGTDGYRAHYETADMEGDRYYIGALMDVRVNNNVKFYSSLEREEGDGYTKDYEISVGMKIRF